MTEKYKMKAIVDRNHFELWQGGEMVRIIGNPIMAFHVEDTLNLETAPLHAEIERLKAELAEAKAFVQDVASADFTATDLRINGASQWRKEAQALVSSWNSTPQDSEDAQESETDNEA